MRIDSHQHFWVYNEREYGWINEERISLRKDFLPVDLSIELGKFGFDGCVAVQARQVECETQFLIDLMEKNPFIKGVVGWLDLRAEDLPAKLEHYAGNKNLKGLRHIVESEPDQNFLLSPLFVKGIGLLREYGLTYDILIFPHHLSAATRLVKMFPDLKFVVDHLAKPFIKAKEIDRWRADMRTLAGVPNVYCKLSGMVTEADWRQWHQDDFIPYMDAALEAFGPDRLMIGSDWPVCLLSASYEEVMSICLSYISRLSQDEQRRIMGENACMFYNLF